MRLLALVEGAMSTMSDPGMDLYQLEVLLGSMEGWANTARTGPSPRDREEAMKHLRTGYEKLTVYLKPEPGLPYSPDIFHKDADDDAMVIP
jgi:hypothetical protein